MILDDVIFLPYAPLVPGLSFRHFRPPDDFQHMARIIRDAARLDGTERADTAEEIAYNYAHLTNCDPATDLILVEVASGNGRPPEVVAYSRVTWRQETSGERLYGFFGRVAPAWRHRGIGGAILRWAENRLRQIAITHPPEVPKSFWCYTEQDEVGLAAMLEKAGYSPARYFTQMSRPDLEDLPDFPLPAGLELRPVLPEHYRLIWEADVEAFRDHWGFIEPTEQEYQAWLGDPIFQPELWQVAWDVATDQVAGQVRTYIDHEQNRLYNRRRGWTEFISVRRPWRRRGLARALIVRSLQAQKAAGMTESALGVDSQNISGATRVYEDCGFQVVKRSAVYKKAL